jgi:hypothetical protein
MARPKKTDNPEQEMEIAPNGAHFGVIQLPRDLIPHPAAQRIVQWVNRNGELKAYVSESAYHRSELKSWFDKLFRESYSASISKGAAALLPVKSRIHWRRFHPDFLSGSVIEGERIDPTTDLPENA